MPEYHALSGSVAEDMFIDLFCETFGAEQAGYLYSQYPFYDIYENSRFADFVLESGGQRVAFEIDDEQSHRKSNVSIDKFQDDLLRQNSMIYNGWKVYRWAVRQLQNQPETVREELHIFLGQHPLFREIQDYLPTQRGQAFELREHQEDALRALAAMRANRETIALLYHATGTGKTTTAVLDAKSIGGRTLFLAHSHELVMQAYNTFLHLWKKATCGVYMDKLKQSNAHIVCGSIQSVALHLDRFKENDFEYLIIDEAHHAAADTYQKVLAYFKPSFTLGLTATPERSDDINILEIFKNTAHKLDIKTAVEIGELVPVRCIRIHTNIDITKVRFNGVTYRARELEEKIFLPERNRLIVDTWLDYVKDKQTVIFCAGVRHAKDIAALLMKEGISALAISGEMKGSQRKEYLAQYEQGEIQVLCACDLLNEGWDSPRTEVLFMARPTMSKVLYMQQLGRGMRKAEGKDCLIVFDFVDNAGRYNIPCSMHRLFQLKDYHPGKLVLGTKKGFLHDEQLYANGEKPEAIIDYPISATDYEAIDLFNWQDEAQGMLSQMEFVRRVNVQSETIERYIREGAIQPDMVVPMGDKRSFKYFNEETVAKYAEQFGWTLIDDANRKDFFMDMCRQMDMSYSYKPVLIQAILLHADNKGKVRLSDIVAYFRKYYQARKENGLVVEKANSIYAKDGYSDKDAERNILSNPFKRFEDMQMLRHTKTLGIIEVDSTVWKNLSPEEKEEIVQICEEKLAQYYDRLTGK